MSVLDRKIQQWRQLLPWERRVLLSLLWRLPVVAVLLRTSSIGKVLARASSRQRTLALTQLPAGMDAATFAQRCEQLVGIAARNGLYQGSCLPRALALQQVLGHFGVQAELKIGVVPGSLPLQAHAWIVCGQEVLGGDVAQYHLIALGPADSAMPVGLRFDESGRRK